MVLRARAKLHPPKVRSGGRDSPLWARLDPHERRDQGGVQHSVDLVPSDKRREHVALERARLRLRGSYTELSADGGVVGIRQKSRSWLFWLKQNALDVRSGLRRPRRFVRRRRGNLWSPASTGGSWRAPATGRRGTRRRRARQFPWAPRGAGRLPRVSVGYGSSSRPSRRRSQPPRGPRAPVSCLPPVGPWRSHPWLARVMLGACADGNALEERHLDPSGHRLRPVSPDGRRCRLASRRTARPRPRCCSSGRRPGPSLPVRAPPRRGGWSSGARPRRLWRVRRGCP
jgi:hypothetical protein